MTTNNVKDRIEDARVHLDPAWDESRADANWAKIREVAEDPGGARLRWALAVAALLVVGLVFSQFRTDPGPSAPAVAVAPSTTSAVPAPPSPGPDAPVPDDGLQLADGTHVVLAHGARLERIHDEPLSVETTLEGAGSFVVPPVEGRRFVVHCNGLDFRVLGTRFELEPESDRVKLTVTEGRVEVSRGTVVIALLVAGQTESFSRTAPETAALPADATVRAVATEGTSKRISTSCAPSGTTTARNA